MNDFMIIPLSIPSFTKLEKGSISPFKHTVSVSCDSLSEELCHYVFVRPHESKKSNDLYPKDKNLFMVNLPIDTTIPHLQRLFRHCGTISRVEFHRDQMVEEFKDFNPISSHLNLHKSASNAHVIVENEDAIHRVMTMKSRKRMWTTSSHNENNENETEIKDEDQIIPFGIVKWIQNYLHSIPETQILQESVDKELLEFEEYEYEMKKEALAKRNVPDADGFITVTRARGRRNTNKDEKGASVVAVSQKQVANLKPKNKELPDFYRFQMRENKRNQLADLRQKFELDKKRIEELKRRRKFKPY